MTVSLSHTFAGAVFCAYDFKHGECGPAGLTPASSFSPADPPGTPIPSTEHHPQHLPDAEAQLHDVASLRHLAPLR